jgi:hypothetical protein
MVAVWATTDGAGAVHRLLPGSVVCPFIHPCYATTRSAYHFAPACYSSFVLDVWTRRWTKAFCTRMCAIARLPFSCTCILFARSARCYAFVTPRTCRARFAFAPACALGLALYGPTALPPLQPRTLPYLPTQLCAHSIVPPFCRVDAAIPYTLLPCYSFNACWRGYGLRVVRQQRHGARCLQTYSPHGATALSNAPLLSPNVLP